MLELSADDYNPNRFVEESPFKSIYSYVCTCHHIYIERHVPTYPTVLHRCALITMWHLGHIFSSRRSRSGNDRSACVCAYVQKGLNMCVRVGVCVPDSWKVCGGIGWGGGLVEVPYLQATGSFWGSYQQPPHCTSTSSCPAGSGKLSLQHGPSSLPTTTTTTTSPTPPPLSCSASLSAVGQSAPTRSQWSLSLNKKRWTAPRNP